MLRVWNLSLLVATFALTILGTFLTRSGVINSVHAFGDGPIGGWLLAGFVAIVAGLARADRMARRPVAVAGFHRLSAVERRRLPRQQRAVHGVSPSSYCSAPSSRCWSRRCRTGAPVVGAPYFDRLSQPIGLVLLFLMGVAPVPAVAQGVDGAAPRPPLLAGVDGGPGASSWHWRSAPMAGPPLVAFGLAGVRRRRGVAPNSCWRPVARVCVDSSGRANGGMVVHIGVILIAVALASSNSFTHSATLSLEQGSEGRVGWSHLRAGLRHRDHQLRGERARAAGERPGGRGSDPQPGDHHVPSDRPGHRHAGRGERGSRRTST